MLVPANHLRRCQAPLGQSYYALRHGQSLANVAKIISSDPKISTVEHGLSPLGRTQAKLAGEAFALDYQKSLSSNNGCLGVAVFTSDFVRARETASLFADELTRRGIPLYQNGVLLETRLRERYFGDLNGGPDSRYQEVWDLDSLDPNHVIFGAESANSVLERTTKFVVDLEEQLKMEQKHLADCDNPILSEKQQSQFWKCVLVAHGDVLQILQTGFLRHEDASQQRSLPHLENATIRELILSLQ